MIRVKPNVNILAMLKEAGYSTYVIQREKLIGQRTLQKLRIGGLPSWNELDKLCKLLKVNPWDIIEFVNDEK